MKGRYPTHFFYMDKFHYRQKYEILHQRKINFFLNCIFLA